MPRRKRIRSEEVEEEGRRKKSPRQEEGKVMESPGGEMVQDPIALLSSPRMAHAANAPLRAGAVTELQRQCGNTCVQRLIRSGAIQPKLTVNRPDDIYEQEADRVADQMTRMPEPQLERQPEEEEEPIQAKGESDRTPEVTPDLEDRINALKGGGQPLPESERAFFEPCFGYDFSQVRVHTDSELAEMAQALKARAFTVGQDIVFGVGQYAPETTAGKELLAHELAHVIQQAEGRVPGAPGEVRLSGDSLEREADRVGRQYGDNGRRRVRSPVAELVSSLSSVPRPVQRQAGQARPTSPLLPQIWDRLASWIKQDQPGRPADLSRDPALRDVLLILYARIGALWSHIRQITWVGRRGEMEFYPVDEGRLQADLIARGYTTSYFAKWGNRWGLREPNVDAAGLHWRGMPEGTVNVHIDLHPPSWTGLWHKIRDDWRRSTTHTPESVRAGVESLGTYIPVLFHQRTHGCLVVRFNELEGLARGRADVLAAISRGRQYLQAAARIIWTRSVISQVELTDAYLCLHWAGLEAMRAERLLSGVASP